MSDKEIREKVALLKDGQIVEIDGNRYKAVRLSPVDDDFPCHCCNVDSNCRYNVFFVCCELDKLSKNSYHLQLIA